MGASYIRVGRCFYAAADIPARLGLSIERLGVLGVLKKKGLECWECWEGEGLGVYWEKKAECVGGVRKFGIKGEGADGMLEGDTLEKSTDWVHGMIAKLMRLIHHVRRHPRFVENKFTERADQCVAEFYTYHGVGEDGIHTYTPRQGGTVEDALRFLVVDVQSRVLQMQAEIGDTIYKDDATVRADLQALLDGMGEGSVYFKAAEEDLPNVPDMPDKEKGVERSDPRMAYIDRVMEDLFELDQRVKNTPGFVENEWTKCVEQCVDEFYEYWKDDENGRALYKPKTTYVEKALHFIAVDVESKLLEMQRDIANTIYKDDARVKQELTTLLDHIDKGFAYFWAASAQQYAEYVQYNLQKLADQVKVQRDEKKAKRQTLNVWWVGWINLSLKNAKLLKEKVEESTAHGESIILRRKKTLDFMAKLVYSKLDLAQKDITEAGYDIGDNSKLLNKIITYIERDIAVPPEGVVSTGVPTAIHNSTPGQEHQGADVPALLAQLQALQNL